MEDDSRRKHSLWTQSSEFLFLFLFFVLLHVLVYISYLAFRSQEANGASEDLIDKFNEGTFYAHRQGKGNKSCEEPRYEQQLEA